MGEKVSKLRQVNGAVFTISGIMALALIGDSLLYSVLPIYSEELGIPLIMVGAILSMNRWIRLISNPVAVKIYGKHTVFNPVLFSILGAVISTAMYAFPLGIVSFLLARSLWGFSFSFLRLGTHLVVLQTSRPVLGLAMGVTQAVSRLGSAFTVITGGVFIDLLGYKTGMLVLAAVSAFAFPLLLLLRSQMKSIPQNLVSEDQEVQIVSENRTLSPMFCLVAAFVTHIVGNGLVVSSLSLLIQQRIVDSIPVGSVTLGIATIAGLVFSSRWLSALALSPVAGYISDRFGRRFPFILVTSLQAVALMLLAMWSLPSATIICTVLFFIFQNSQKVFLDTSIGDSAVGADRNEIIGRYNSFQDLGAAMGPVLGYGIGAILGFEQVYLGASLMLLAMGIVAFPYRSRKGMGRHT